MRTWILVLLGGGALYFAWTRYGTVDASTPPNGGTGEVEFPDALEDTPGGALSSLAELQAAADSAEPFDEEPPVAPREAASDREADSESAETDEFDELDLNALGDPLYEGSLLLHRPDDLQGYLNDRGKGLSKARKRLLIAYLLLARGQRGQVPKYADGLEDARDVTAEEVALVQRGLNRQAIALHDGTGRPWANPLVLGASMAMIDRRADEAAIAAQWGETSQHLSQLLLAELDAPWQPDQPTLERWAVSLADAQSSHRWSPDGDWPSIEVTVRPDDTLIGIRKRVLNDRPTLTLCTGLIERANRQKGYLREDEVLRIPTDRVRTIVDISANWLYYLHGNEVVAAYRVATGREGQETEPGRHTVGEKQEEPTWFPPGRVVPYGDDENPLGTRWITLENSNSLGIHGTWEPETIGTMASDGCIRLLNEDVEVLFEIIPKGTEVILRP